MEFTKEEISLCKQVAEKYRKEIKKGDWFICEEIDSQILLFDNDKYQDANDGEISDVLGFYKEWFPLWIISDCLEFLRERNFEVSLCYFKKFSGYRIQIWKPEKTQAFYSDYDLDRSLKQCTHKTPLEACLKAVLAVLEEGK